MNLKTVSDAGRTSCIVDIPQSEGERLAKQHKEFNLRVQHQRGIIPRLLMACPILKHRSILTF